MSYVQLYFAKVGENAVQVNGITVLINTVLIVCSLRFLTKAIKGWSDRRINFVGSFLIGLGTCVTPLVGNSWFLYVGIVLMTLGEMIYLPWSQTQLFNCFPDEQPGLASGAVSLLTSFVFVLAPVWSSFLLTLPDLAASALILALPLFGFALNRQDKKIQKDELPLAA